MEKPINTLKLVKEWHSLFKVPIKNEPYISDPVINKLRLNLLREEVDELEEALDEQNIVEVLDALTDIQYILDGSYLSLGLHIAKYKAFIEVHRSNMSKADDAGLPIIREDGKILKSDNYEPPNLHPILAELYVNPVRTKE